MICREVNYHYVDIVKKDLLSLDKLAFRRFQKFIIDFRNGEKMVEVLEQYMQENSKHCVLGWIHGYNHADQIYRKRMFPIVSLGCAKVEDFKHKN